MCSVSLASFNKQTKKNIEEWLFGPYDEATKQEIQRLLVENPKELEHAFFQNLSFGTGGIRAIMGVGTNRLNEYTIRFATQGLATYLKKQYPSQNISVLIGFDNRKNSALFAQESAKVLAGNDIKAFIFSELRPTPIVSFGCRYKKCQAAIMITASHNPPQYNGFKVYGQDGAQVLPPHDQGILEEIKNIKNTFQVKMAPFPHPLIELIKEEIDQEYLLKLNSLNSFQDQNRQYGDTLHIVYTNLHGTGITIVPKALSKWGFSSLSLVESQKTIDPNFTFAKSPNPEEKEALEPGIKTLLSQKKDLLLATDPDADRIGVVVRHKDQPVILTGNQIACLLVQHLCESKKLPENGAFIKSIVTSDLFSAITSFYQKPTLNVLTGFKYIAEKIQEWEISQNFSFIFGAEESLGYLAETFVRDKDAISASCLLAQMALIEKRKNKTLVDKLYEIYQTHGIFRESVFSLSLKEGEEGMKQLVSLMDFLRNNPPKNLCDLDLVRIEDFEQKISFDLIKNTKEALLLPSSNMLIFHLSDQSKIVIRPSGTEPKIKIYLFCCLKKKNLSIDEGIKKCEEHLQKLKNHMIQTLSHFL